MTIVGVTFAIGSIAVLALGLYLYLYDRKAAKR